MGIRRAKPSCFASLLVIYLKRDLPPGLCELGIQPGLTTKRTHLEFPALLTLETLPSLLLNDPSIRCTGTITVTPAMSESGSHLLNDDQTPSAPWRLLKYLLTLAPLEHLQLPLDTAVHGQAHQSELIQEINTHLILFDGQVPATSTSVGNVILENDLSEELGERRFSGYIQDS